MLPFSMPVPKMASPAIVVFRPGHLGCGWKRGDPVAAVAAGPHDGPRSRGGVAPLGVTRAARRRG